MKVLIACEESQDVTVELRKIGIEAFSCDIQETSGNNPECHIKADIREILKLQWDCIISFPPCTDLASSGARWFLFSLICSDIRKQKQRVYGLKALNN